MGNQIGGRLEEAEGEMKTPILNDDEWVNTSHMAWQWPGNELQYAKM